MAASKVVKLNNKKKDGKRKGPKAKPVPRSEQLPLVRCPFTPSGKLPSKFAAMLLDRIWSHATKICIAKALHCIALYCIHR